MQPFFSSTVKRTASFFKNYMESYKIRILFLLVFSFPVFLQAQGFRAGVLTGVTASQISGDQLGGFDKAGLMIGGMVSTRLGKKLDLAMEILYIQKGSKKNPKPDIGDYTSYLLRLNYFEVPLMLQWHYSKRFTFEGGFTWRSEH